VRKREGGREEGRERERERESILHINISKKIFVYAHTLAIPVQL
jgi:hypothetical protein